MDAAEHRGAVEQLGRVFLGESPEVRRDVIDELWRSRLEEEASLFDHQSNGLDEQLQRREEHFFIAKV